MIFPLGSETIFAKVTFVCPDDAVATAAAAAAPSKWGFIRSFVRAGVMSVHADCRQHFLRAGVAIAVLPEQISMG